jgi:hypothetical protein
MVIIDKKNREQTRQQMAQHQTKIHQHQEHTLTWSQGKKGLDLHPDRSGNALGAC